MTIQLSKPCLHIYPATVVAGKAVIQPCRHCEHVADRETFARIGEGHKLLVQSILRPLNAPTPRHLRAVQ
jgi:hypothetical protein